MGTKAPAGSAVSTAGWRPTLDDYFVALVECGANIPIAHRRLGRSAAKTSSRLTAGAVRAIRSTWAAHLVAHLAEHPRLDLVNALLGVEDEALVLLELGR